MKNNDHTEIIIEIAQAHEGSLGILHSYIDAIAETGADTIKFQMHFAEAESSEYEPFRVNFSYEDQTRFDYWKRMSFTEEQWMGIKKHCEDKKLGFLCSPFSVKAVELLERMGVNRYKIASGETENLLMLERIAQTGKPVLISSGMNSLEEIENVIDFFKERNTTIGLFQCTTSYPTSPEEVGLNIITEMIAKYDFPIGLSDHSGNVYASFAAVTLGARMIEVHAVFDKRMFGPDSKASLTIDQISDLITGVRYIETAISTKVQKNNNSKYLELKKIFGKSLAIRRDLPKGHMLQFDDLESKKPVGYGIPAAEYEKVIGRKMKTDIKQYAFLNYSDLYE